MNKPFKYDYSKSLQLFNIKTSEIDKKVRKFMQQNKIKYIDNETGVKLFWDPNLIGQDYVPTEDKNIHLFAIFAFDGIDFIDMELSKDGAKLEMKVAADKFVKKLN